MIPSLYHIRVFQDERKTLNYYACGCCFIVYVICKRVRAQGCTMKVTVKQYLR
jgi:hypothetical protein